jgi:hypothetical protein
MRGVKCVVFVETTGEHRRRLIGLASPEAVRTALVGAYPWLEEALSQAMIKYATTHLSPLLLARTAGDIIRDFIERPEMRAKTLPSPPGQWTQLGTEPIWEHTERLTIETTNKYLRKYFYEWDSSHYKDLPGIPSEKRSKELLHRKSPFVALLNSRDEFQRLVDRQKLAVLIGEAMVDR